jgi:hypothetical protein
MTDIRELMAAFDITATRCWNSHCHFGTTADCCFAFGETDAKKQLQTGRSSAVLDTAFQPLYKRKGLIESLQQRLRLVKFRQGPSQLTSFRRSGPTQIYLFRRTRYASDLV